jgi:hypothetical protein
LFGGAAVAWISILIVAALRRHLAGLAVGPSVGGSLASRLAVGASLQQALVKAKSKSA